jgi:hypothetical protein
MVGKCDDNEDYSIVSTIIVKVSNLNGMPDNNILVMIILSIYIIYYLNVVGQYWLFTVTVR